MSRDGLDRQKSYDYVIVGGGSAGCAIANRLSADPASTVLVLEAGRSDYIIDPFIHMPAALPIPIGNRLYDWKYETDPEPYMNGRKVFHARGKILGGSSSINGMIFQRGNPMDYQRWAADPGMESWDYLHCLPYFKRMESLILEDGRVGADEWRGGSGPLRIERGSATNPLFGAFFEAAHQAGYPLTDDVNGYRQEGFARFDRNIHRGRRWSAARAYLHPVRNRKNLDVETSSFATRVRFDGTRAVGVDYTGFGRRPRSVDAGEAVLHPLEVRQAAEIVPVLHARLGSPALEVERVAALKDHSVDAAGPAQDLAASVEDAPTVHERLGLRLVLPVVEPVTDRDRQRGRHVHE
ncbi:MAG: choline dehydrogenase, partial [Kribbellaceae bacterium]|nr:choline dehydrogenase [Kribbellaceae bacterium]